MGIGTSKGAFYRDEGHYGASKWNNRYDDNVVDPAIGSADDNQVSPEELNDRQQFPVPQFASGTMPFPDNKNPDSTFDSRFGNLPPSGILNDLKKPRDTAPALVRRISDIENAPFGVAAPIEIPEGSRQGRGFPVQPSGPQGPSTNNLVPPNKMGITDQDLERSMEVGMSFSGGGLTTSGRNLSKALSEKMAPHEVEEIMKYYKQVPFNEGDYFIKQADNIPKGWSEVGGGAKVGDTVGDAPKYQAYIDMFMDKAANTVKEGKLDVKEAFKQAARETHETFVNSMNDIADRFRTMIKGPVEEPFAPKSVRPEAAAKGYDTPAYRGVNSTELQSVHPGFTMYSSESPLLADMYSSFLKTHPGQKIPEGTFAEGSQVLPLYINTKDYHLFDAQGKGWATANQEAIREARELNAPGVHIRNVWDEPSSTRALGKPKNIFITFQEGLNTVKSRFAKEFDPNSPDMMHSTAGIGIGSALGYVSVEAKEHDGNFNTILSPAEEKKFETWKEKYAPKDSGEDYDLRGAFKAGITPDPKTKHWPDTYKKPNHETFSDESKYAKEAPDLAGSWDGETYIPPAVK